MHLRVGVHVQVRWNWYVCARDGTCVSAHVILCEMTRVCMCICWQPKFL